MSLKTNDSGTAVSVKILSVSLTLYSAAAELGRCVFRDEN